MKYLFINSVAGVGSTGRIAADQCRKLEKEGHQCVLAYGRAKVNCDDIQTIQIGTPWDYRWHGIITRVFDRHGFGSKRATRKFLVWVEEYKPDLVWLHNIHGYYINVEMLFVWLKKHPEVKVMWTLHDCWAFTGHCTHFTVAKCNQWKKKCLNCTQLRQYPSCIVKSSVSRNFEQKRQAFTGVRNLTLVTPSKWLAKLTRESFLSEYPVTVHYNTIDTNVFKPTPGDFRKKYRIERKTVILGVASVWTERKGLKDFYKLAELLDDSYAIVLVGINEKQLKRLPDNIIGIPRTNSPTELAEIYTMADVFVNPTYEDNYPTVNLEAQACSTPVITYDTGGACETIYNGEVVHGFDELLSALLKKSLYSALDKKPLNFDP